MTAAMYNLLYLWSFLLCCIYIWTVFYSFAMKNTGYIISSVFFEILSFYGLQMVKYTATLPLAAWHGVLTVLLIYGIYLCIRTDHWRKNHITPMSIRYCGDRHPAGIIFWNNQGKVLYSNACADDISISLFGTPIMNGMEFFSALEGKNVIFTDGRTWNYRHQTSILDGDVLHEIIITDITEIYKKTEELQEDTAQLAKLNAELAQYSRKIEEFVSHQETLNTKIRIHDEMNHLLMSTGRVFEENNAEKQKEILEAWKKNTALLSQNYPNEQTNNILGDLLTYGRLMGVELVCEKLPDFKDNTTKLLFVHAAREAMNNAAKHGNATHVYLKYVCENGILQCSFTDDGKTVNNPEAVPSGGLLNLQREAANAGCTVNIKTEPEFTLTVTIPTVGEKI